MSKFQDDIIIVRKTLNTAKELETKGEKLVSISLYTTVEQDCESLSVMHTTYPQWVGAAIGSVLGVVLTGPFFWTGTIFGAFVGGLVAQNGYGYIIKNLKQEARLGLERLRR